MNKWDNSKISAACKVLGHHKTIKDALPDISKAVGFKVTTDSLNKSFRASCAGPPSEHLKQEDTISPKQLLEAQIQKKLEKKQSNRQAITDILIEKVELALSKIKPATIKVVKEKLPTSFNKEEEKLFFILSDVQLGTYVQAEKTNNINEHDWTIFLKKLNNWKNGVKQTIRERAQHQSIKEVVIALNGDLVEGATIFAGQAHEIDADIYQQIFYGVRDFSEAFIDIFSSFPSVKFNIHCVGGNHGRIGNRGEQPFRVNFDIILSHFIKLNLQAAKLPNVTCHVEQSWFTLIKLWGYSLLLTHGDGIPSFGGSPINGLNRALGKYTRMLQRNINYMVVGHFHTESMVSTSSGDIIINGCWPGGTMYAKEILETNTAVQLALGFTERNGLTWCKKIYLQDREASKPTPTVYLYE